MKKSGSTFQLCGAGELSCFQFANLGFQAVNTTLEDGQLGFELSHQATQLVGHFSDAVEASVQQGSRFVAGHGPVATGRVPFGVTGNAAIGLHQVGQSLIGPVGGVDVRELSDAGDLISGSRVIRNTVDVSARRHWRRWPGRPRAAGATSSWWKSFIEFLTQQGPIWALIYCCSAVLSATRLIQLKVDFYTPLSSFDTGIAFFLNESMRS